MKTILHTLSYGNIEVDSSRKLADLKQLDAMRIFVKKLDAKVYNGDHAVPIRLYFPTEEAMQAGIVEGNISNPAVFSWRWLGNGKRGKL